MEPTSMARVYQRSATMPAMMSATTPVRNALQYPT